MISRSRVVNFRLTQQEYEELRSASVQRGERSISEFTRSAVLGIARAGSGADGSLESRLAYLDQKLSRLSLTVGELARWLKIGRGEAGEDLSGGL